MMYLMIHTDIVRVAIIFCIFLSGFAIGTHNPQTNPWVFKAKTTKSLITSYEVVTIVTDISLHNSNLISNVFGEI